VVTPRTGKAVEINALWHNALRAMIGFARALARPASEWQALADRAATGFDRFWNVLPVAASTSSTPRPETTVDQAEPDLRRLAGREPALPERQRGVVEVCARRLLTSFGLRSLDPRHPDYSGRYHGGPRERDGTYHQGTVWGWLLGPFALAYFKVYGDAGRAGPFSIPSDFSWAPIASAPSARFSTVIRLTSRGLSRAGLDRGRDAARLDGTRGCRPGQAR
jgi:glycogen debranching enzyme